MELKDWLKEHLEMRGWRQATLARKAGVASGQLNRVLEGEPADDEFCLGIAQALGVPPNKVLRLAGLAPSFPVTDARLNQLVEWLILLDEDDLDRIYGDVQRMVFCRSMDYQIERLGR